MSHSTHVGFSPPKGLPCCIRKFLTDWARLSCTVCPLSLTGFQLPVVPPWLALGVGQNTASLSAAFGCPASSIRFCDALPMSDATGVGNNPDPISVMVRAKFGSWYTVPLRIIPDLGNVPEYSLKPSSPFSIKQVCDVFKDGVSGSKLPKQTGAL